MKFLIGIDDTDNKDSRGTGFRSRDLGNYLEAARLGRILGVSRHQLLVDDRIPYTSKNSSACIEIESSQLEAIISFSRVYLLKESAIGADVGLCIINKDRIDNEVVDWGTRAKKEVLSINGARNLANKHGIFLEGLTGTGGGIIGAMAAIGLRHSGNDGRFVWLRGKDLRELEGVFNFWEIKSLIPIDKIKTIHGNDISPEARVYIGKWIRPVLKNNKIVIIVEPSRNTQSYEWEVASKENIRSISN
ncbi:hypothetical protein ACFLSI_06580 [Bacteroidota bacterium]